MARDVTSHDSDQLSKLVNNPYYKAIQKELQERTTAHDMGDQPFKDSDTNSEDDTKVAAATHTKTAESSKKLIGADKVQIRSFSWTKDDSGSYVMDADVSANPLTSVDLKHDAAKVLRSSSAKIDFSGRVGELKQSYMQNTVQQYSHNFFLSKYAQFKVGMLGALLGVLGITPEELRELQKKAVTGAADENIMLMEENLYNMELVEIIHGRSKKSLRSLKMLSTIEQQLKGQMERLGKKDYWNKVKVLETRVSQLKKIEEEFLKEQGVLAYQMEFAKQHELSET